MAQGELALPFRSRKKMADAMVTGWWALGWPEVCRRARSGGWGGHCEGFK